MTQERLKEKQVTNGPINPNVENSFTHEVACLRREIAEQKALIEKLKEEPKGKSRIHEAAITNMQNKDWAIA